MRRLFGRVRAAAPSTDHARCERDESEDDDGTDDERGGVVGDDGVLEPGLQLLETSVPEIFAVGDVRHRSVKRVAAVGEGSVAVTLVHE